MVAYYVSTTAHIFVQELSCLWQLLQVRVKVTSPSGQMHISEVCIHRKQLPETTSVVRMFSFCQLLGEHHLLAVSQLLQVVRHPRDRLAVANSDISVVFQPRVRPLQQLPTIGDKQNDRQHFLVSQHANCSSESHQSPAKSTNKQAGHTAFFNDLFY